MSPGARARLTVRVPFGDHSEISQGRNHEIRMSICQRCGEREAEVFQTQHVGSQIYERDLCTQCAKQDYGVFLGALLQSHAPGAPPLTEAEERELRRVLDEAAPPESTE
jgi:hypothetical protein